MSISRRAFIGGGIGAGVAGSLGALDAVLRLPPVSAAETAVTPEVVRFTPEIERLVRLIEETPRGKCVEVMAHQLRQGMTYRQFLGSLFLAGIRNVNPQPPGFKFHCVFIIHSCNYLAQMGPPEERYLPLFYALDDFKNAQVQDVEQGDFVLKPVAGVLPPGQRAWDEFHAAMETWDEPRADRAITAIVRENDHEAVFEGLWRYGARDYRNIGHKIIFVAHAHRTLAEIGWEHVEPTLRSLMLGLLDFGADEVVNAYAFDDQSYIGNAALAREQSNKLPGNWTESAGNPAVTQEIHDTLRSGDMAASGRRAVEHLAAGTCTAGAIWDAVHLAADELMMRQPGVIGVHTVTSTNSMHYAFRASVNPETRLLMLLQGLGWIAQFRNFMRAERDAGIRIDDMAGAALPDSEREAVDVILAAVSSDRYEAARMAYAFDQRYDARILMQAARHLVFTKCREHHQYKWPAAIFEDYGLVSPAYRPHMLATAMHYLRGSGHPDSPVIERALGELQRV